MKTRLILGLIPLMLFACTIFATTAEAQQYQQGQFHMQGTRMPVNGTTYTNSNFGLQVSVPDGWSGFELKRTSGSTTVMLAPGGFQFGQGQMRPTVTIFLSMMPLGSIPYVPHFMPRYIQDGETCTNSTSVDTVNGMSLNETTVECSGSATLKAQYDVAKTSSAYVTLGLRADSDSDFQSQSPTFDAMLGTLQLGGGQNATTQGVVIPSWVKKNAGYWSAGQVGDTDFVQGMQYLIQQGMMKILTSAQSSTTNSSSQQIPSWIKNNAGWWASGQISDGEFVKGMQWLVSNGIIKAH